MPNNKKEFLSMYDQSVQLLRKFKQSNDSINKSIGIEHDNSINLKIMTQKTSHNILIKRLDQILQKLQQSYLDPDTARKIGTVKQQYKIQKDRRSHLLSSLTGNDDNKMPHQNSESENYIKYTLANTHNYDKNSKNINFRRKLDDQNQSRTTSHTINNANQQQVIQYDYQIQCKLLNQKNVVLKQAERTLLNVYQIQKQCEQMVNYQGEHLEIISDEIFKTKQNTTAAVKQLKQANQLSKKRRKKIITFSIFILIATIFIIAFALF